MFYKLSITLLSTSEECLYTLSLHYIKSIKFKFKIIAQFQHVPTCIVGDFNEDVSITSNMCCCTMFRLQGFKQMLNKPTHDSGTIIDHLYMSQT